VTPIFLVVGPPAVGKSTTARALATRFQKSIHIPVDDMREMVVSGLLVPGFDWNEGLVEQLTLARENVIHMAKTYSKAGFAVVIDDFWDPFSRLNEYVHLFQELNVHKVLLFPDEQVAIERNVKRSGLEAGDENITLGIRVIYGFLETAIIELKDQGWIILDTTGRSVETIVDEILSQVE